MKVICLDFETYYSKEYSLSKMTTQEYIRHPEFKVYGAAISIDKGQSKWFTGETLRKVLTAVVPGNLCVSHNAAFDHSILAWQYSLHPKLSVDTVSMSRALIGERLRKHSLDSISQYLFKTPKGGYLSQVMGVRELDAYQEHKLAEYCILDNDLCRRIFFHLLPHIPKQELYVMDWVTRMFTHPQLLLDAGLLRKYHSEVVAKKLTALDVAGVSDPKELMSNPKFADALSTLGVDPPMKVSPTTGKETFAFAKTDQGLLELTEHEDVRVQALVAARLENKGTLAETRAAAYLRASDFGPWPVSYLYSGAMTTHRLSGTNGSGGNPQNLTRGGDLRRSIMAPHGHTLVAGDLSQIELRVTFALAGQTDALDILRTGQDLYGWFGSKVYNKEVNKKDTPLERQVSKSAVLGCGFGMGPARFLDYSKTSGITLDATQAESLVKFYRTTFNCVPKLWYSMERMLTSLVLGEQAEMRSDSGDILFEADVDPMFKDPAVKLYGGLYIKYPGLSKDDDGWGYTRNENVRTKLFGGKVVENCLGADTDVLTPKGWKKVIDITPNDLLWDGESWVAHEGVINQGEHETINFGGVLITPDHKVLINDEWKTAKETHVDEATETYERSYRLP